MRKLLVVFLCPCVLASFAQTANPVGIISNLPVPVSCQPPVTEAQCSEIGRLVIRAVQSYRDRLPADWQWWIVPKSKWEKVVGREAARLSYLALTDTEQHISVFNFDVYRGQEAQLEFALAHEASHVICKFDRWHEANAKRAARRILAGEKEVCSD